MKRPRWLGSGESNEEGASDEDSAAESPTDEADEKSSSLSAAERSARRTARKSLGARVAGDDPEATGEKPKRSAARPEKPRRAPAPSAKPKDLKPKAKAKPKAETDAEEEPKREAKAKPKAETEAKTKAGGADEPAKKLHRPRPQKRGEGDEKTTQRGKERGKPAKAKRKPFGPRVRAGVGASAKALRQGAVETRKQVAVSAPKFGRRALGALGALFAIFFGILGFVLGILIAVGIFVGRPIRWLLVRLRRWTDSASRIVTPTRVLALVVAGAAILLALSQYADYRSISIGNDAYSGVQTVAPAPETGRLPAGDAHSYVFVPIGIVCLLLLGGALTGRWRLCRLISLAGVAAIVVAIVVDRPAGLDTGDTALAFEGVRATLLGGFYAQIAAGVLLIGSSSLLARELRLAGATERAKPERGRKRRERRTTAPPSTDTRGARA